MHITIEFDFSQKDLMGEKQEMDVQEGTTLLQYLKSVDLLIEEACRTKGMTADPLRIVQRSGDLNSCIVAVDGQTPPDLLHYRLKDGDTVSLIYGYCGG